MKNRSALVALDAGLLAVVVCSTVAIIATYSRLSHTFDEATHVAAGVELLQDGNYTIQTENPPLSRVVLALIPFLDGARLPPPAKRTQPPISFAVDSIFYRTPSYLRNVTEARVANLAFFWACIVLTWLAAGGRSDPWVAFLASAFVASLPPIVSHSGFATTDVAFVASVMLSLVTIRSLVANPTTTSAVVAGAAIGIAVATKFSTLVFLPPIVGALIVASYWDRRGEWGNALTQRAVWRTLSWIATTAGLVVWASYGFDIGRLSDLPTRFGPYGEMPTTGWPALIRDWQLPGHQLLHGLLFLRAHTIAGHGATLFDQFSQRGFLLFYPVVLATKTPIPFLVFAVVGMVSLVFHREDQRWPWFVGLAAGALGVLLVSLNSPINLGVRHVLVIYPLVAAASAFGLVRLADRSRHRVPVLTVGIMCLGLQVTLLMTSAPHQVTYFNAFAGDDPAHISSDSDFDWGQHGVALEEYFVQHPVPELYVLLSGTVRTCSLKLPPIKALPNHPVSGWIAISEGPYRLNQGAIREDPCGLGPLGKTFTARHGWLDWLKAHKPVAIIGKTVRLYHIESHD